jgi:hypothetical protein
LEKKNGKLDALTGSHRIFAARKAGIDIPAIIIKEPKTKLDSETESLWEDLHRALDDDYRESAILALAKKGQIDKQASELMSDEIEFNLDEYEEYKEKEKILKESKTKKSISKDNKDKNKDIEKSKEPNVKKMEQYSDFKKVLIDKYGEDLYSKASDEELEQLEEMLSMAYKGQ